MAGGGPEFFPLPPAGGGPEDWPEEAQRIGWGRPGGLAGGGPEGVARAGPEDWPKEAWSSFTFPPAMAGGGTICPISYHYTKLFVSTEAFLQQFSRIGIRL